MRHSMITVLLLASCGGSDNAVAPGARDPIAARPAQWDLQSSGEGAALVLVESAGTTSLRMFCPAGAGTLQVNVPGFDPIGSEERMSFGQGGEVDALVADPNGDTTRGGVTGAGPVPTNLTTLLSGGVTASYGAQISGPHAQPRADLVAAFVGACAEGASEVNDPSSESSDTPLTQGGVSACLTQDGRPIAANTLRAFGTEPFWGAQVVGRCVTYSHPLDQAGTRVWTTFSGSAANGVWSGALDGQPFVMRTRPQSGCSDSMSDNLYAIAVSLTVGGEQRSGCAE